MGWWRRKNREQDLEREIRSDLELEAEEQEASGLSPRDARDAARRAFGNVTWVKEEVRIIWGWTFWEIVFQELRHAARTLRKSPGFAATAFLTLALAIGAATAVFTVVDSVLLKPLAFQESGRLVACWERVRSLRDDATGPNPRHVEIWRQRATGFSGLTYLQYAAMGLSLGAEHPRLINGVTALPNFFDVLRVHALLGRTFSPEDGIPGHDNVAVLSYPLWQDLFQGDPAAIGAAIRLGDGVSRQVVGVLPADFHFPSGSVLRSFRRAGQSVSAAPEPALYLPAALDVTKFEWNGNYGNWITLGRLNPGVTLAQASAQLDTIQAQIVADPAWHADRRPGVLGAWVQPMQEAVVGDSRTALLLLMASVLGLMLIACLNLANAQLSRALARSRESAVRAALGAARWRLIWNALAENLLLAAAGGAAGILLARAALDLFLRDTPVGLPRLSEVRLNPGVLLFSILLTVGASVLSGVGPALRLLAGDPKAALQSGSRSLGSRHGNRLRRWLIGVQVAGSTALLLLTGLFSRSLLTLLHEEKGFDTTQTAVAEVRLTPQKYSKDQSRAEFDDAVLANLRAIPGVQSAALVSAMPLGGESWIEAVQRMDRPQLETPLINFRWVSPGYFETTRQHL